MENDLKALQRQFESLAFSVPFILKCKKILIYGAGNIGKDVHRVLISHGFQVMGFLDRTARPKQVWNGIPILLPNDEKISPAERKLITIIIAIHNRDADIPQAIQAIKALGYTDIVTLIELYDSLGHELGNRFWLTARSYYKSIEPVISDGVSIWADETSRSLYTTILRFRLTGDYAILPKPDQEHQYFPADIPAHKTPLRLVDCGAYDGDTLASMLRNKIQMEAVAAFEPDPENFEKLVKYIDASEVENVTLWPCGVYSSTKQLSFAAGKGEAGKLSPQGDALIQCVALDEVIPRFKPTLIKMDIEGAEYEALLGARRIIQQDRPALAICVYHRPGHIWEIPLLIQSWNCGYRFYLRSHAYNGFDLVIYAISEKLMVTEA